MDPTTDSLTTTLITLLDQHNTIKGLHIFAHPDRPGTTLPLPPADGTPIAIQMNTTPSLATHLAAPQTDSQTLNKLLSKIHTLLKTHPSASPATHAHLNTTYRNLTNTLTPQQRQITLDTAKFAAQADLSKKLALPRQTQHHLSAPQLERPAEFVTNLVADVDCAERPDPMLKLYLPVDVEWAEYERALTVNTHRRWTDGFSYDDDDGDDDDEGDGMVQFPTFQDDDGSGGWVYQRTSSSGQAEPISRSLTNSVAFRGMLNGTGGGKGEWGGNVLVWSARVFEASQTARKVEKEARKAGADTVADFKGVGVEGLDFGSP